MVTDSQARIVITDSTFADALGSQTVTTMTLAETSSATELRPRVNHGPEDLAYIIYTSGSTGKPKGVEVTHRTAVNFLCSMQREPGITDTDILLAVTTICFDISVLEIFLPLVSGATVVIASGDDVVDGSSLVSRIEENDVSVMQATPATWRLMLAADWAGSSNLKALCGGEAMPAELIQELYPRAGGGLWNMYGPTETTVWSSTYKLQSAEERPLIGRPIANTRMYVLDSGMQPMPVGVPGELYIAGEGVVRGYHNRPDLTAERFFVDPFVEGGRMYRTGDVARYCADGNIEYLHRIDNQVKIRGFRIELGEIETVLVGHEVIRQGVVTVHNEHGGDARLVAYVVHEEGKHTTASELRKFLRARLPDYMVPTMYVDVPAIPLTPSGKLDRKSLPDPFRRGTAKAGEYTPARTDMEKRIATIWQEALNVESVGIHDNFFDLGGHSLLSMRVIARIERETGCRIGPRAMVMDTLEQIALACPEAARVDAEDQRATPPPARKTLFEKIRQSLGL
jgi:amino acid adenylation domain-containing protein